MTTQPTQTHSVHTLAPGKTSYNSVAWSPDSTSLALGGDDGAVYLCTAAGHLLRRLAGHTAVVWSVAFAPDGRWLASASADESVRLWEVASGREVRQFLGHTTWVWSVAFAPDGRWLASASQDQSVRLWEVASGREVRQFLGHTDWVRSVAFAPDGRWLASASDDRSIRLWEVASGREVRQFLGHTHWVWSVAFAPDGRWLASASGDRNVCIWDVSDLVTPTVTVSSSASAVGQWLARQAATVGRRLAGSVPQAVASTLSTPQAVSAELASLPAALVALHRLQQYPPLGWVQDLQALLTGQRVPEALAALSAQPGVVHLRGLHWPQAARVGLLALLLRHYQQDDWRPPAELSFREVRRQLTTALAGEPVPPDAPPPPLALVTQAAETIDERVRTLLSALGAEAVARDPGLPLRLLPQVAQLPKLAEAQHRLLSVRLAPLETGPAQGSGLGVDRTGIAPKGPLTALVPSQLAYPQNVFAWRYQTNTLLYRARTGREPPRLRPAVIVLDVSPPCYGPVEALTRVAAHSLASSLRHQGVPVVLLTAGGPCGVYPLEHPADLLTVFTARTLKAVEAQTTLQVAQRLCPSLAHEGTEAVILLLTHAWWGAEEPEMPGIVGLRGFFVQYPGQHITPAWAHRCERWESLGPTQFASLPTALGRLLG
ncbi:MAG: WD40 repeat domain-containing protein [Deltaproteobacteria bacterium]|nr:WD40 repeat domain-containing protein [Deltaproteobacteria bacterium]